MHNQVNAIIERHREIWIAGDLGVNVIQGSSWQTLPDSFYFTIGPIESRKVTTIHFDKYGAIWFGLAGGGIKYFNDQSSYDHWSTIKSPSLNNNFIYGITHDILGDVWVATGNGLSRFIYGQTREITDGRWVQYNQENSLVPDEAITSVGYNLYENTVVIGTSSQGVISYDGDLDWNIFLPSDQPLPIISMAFPGLKKIWFGTFSDWAYLFDTHTDEWVQFGRTDSTDGLPDNFVNSVAVDNERTWFGTNNGLALFSMGSWHIFNGLNSPLPSNKISCLLVDSKGNLWIGTDKGLAEFRAGGTVP